MPRKEFFVRFGQAPLIARGIRLRSWRTGSKIGQPKLPPTVASMIGHSLVTLQPTGSPRRRVDAVLQAGEGCYNTVRIWREIQKPSFRRQLRTIQRWTCGHRGAERRHPGWTKRQQRSRCH